jgi:hypothetical protein
MCSFDPRKRDLRASINRHQLSQKRDVAGWFRSRDPAREGKMISSNLRGPPALASQTRPVRFFSNRNSVT